MAIKTFTTGEVLTASDTNTYLANSGMVYIKSQTIGSAVASVTVSDAFSATYDNYKITLSGGGNGSGGREVRMQLGATATGYHYWLAYAPWTSTISAEGAKTAVNFPYCGASSSTGSGGGQRMNLEISNPFLSSYTTISAPWDDDTSNVGTLRGGLFNTTSYTSFTLTLNSGALFTGGTITVYGYRKA